MLDISKKIVHIIDREADSIGFFENSKRRKSIYFSCFASWHFVIFSPIDIFELYDIEKLLSMKKRA